MPGARCARSLACSKKSTRVSHHRFTGTPSIPCAMVLTACFVLSPVIGLSCHRHRRNYFRQLDAGVEASGPHDLAVRKKRSRQQHHLRPPHPVPNVRDDRDTPLMRDGMADHSADLHFGKTEIFLQKGLDRRKSPCALICPSGKKQSTDPAAAAPRSSTTRLPHPGHDLPTFQKQHYPAGPPRPSSGTS
jgi:hypothetical protein